MLNKDFIKFLKDLNKNNNRDWFQENKKRYETSVKKPFEELVTTVVEKIQAFDPEVQIEPKKAIFRIYRDVRFSKDKSPYKTHVGAAISPRGRKFMNDPGYYLHISGGSVMLGGGAYGLDKEGLYNLRQHIINHPKEFKKLISRKTFADKFGELRGEKNKRLPVEFREAAETQPLLFNKQFYFMSELKPSTTTEKDFVKTILSYYKAATPLNEFFRSGLNQ